MGFSFARLADEADTCDGLADEADTCDVFDLTDNLLLRGSSAGGVAYTRRMEGSAAESLSEGGAAESLSVLRSTPLSSSSSSSGVWPPAEKEC